jgi:hypothetical protein
MKKSNSVLLIFARFHFILNFSVIHFWNVLNIFRFLCNFEYFPLLWFFEYGSRVVYVWVHDFDGDLNRVIEVMFLGDQPHADEINSQNGYLLPWKNPRMIQKLEPILQKNLSDFFELISRYFARNLTRIIPGIWQESYQEFDKNHTRNLAEIFWIFLDNLRFLDLSDFGCTLSIPGCW